MIKLYFFLQNTEMPANNVINFTPCGIYLYSLAFRFLQKLYTMYVIKVVFGFLLLPNNLWITDNQLCPFLQHFPQFHVYFANFSLQRSSFILENYKLIWSDYNKEVLKFFYYFHQFVEMWSEARRGKSYCGIRAFFASAVMHYT